jgi:hypothetical protein
MAENSNNIMVQYTAKVTKEVKDRLLDIVNSGEFRTVNQVFETLLEVYENPKKIKDDNLLKIKGLTEENDKFSTELDLRLKEKIELQVEKDKLLFDLGKLQDENGKLQNEISNLRETNLIINISPLTQKILEYLSDRESKRRGRNIPYQAIVMYAVEELLIKGNKFAIDCVPDSVINKLKKEVEL